MPQLERELPALDKPPSGSPPPTGPCVMVIFGGTGDLTARKLFPALYNLLRSKLLSSLPPVMTAPMRTSWTSSMRMRGRSTLVPATAAQGIA